MTLDYANLPTGQWHRDGEIVREGQGMYAPEILATDAWSVRYVKRDGDPVGVQTYTVITFYAAGVYANDESRAAGIVDVQSLTEALVCTDPSDPGSTEIASDLEYEYRNHVSLTISEAEKRSQDIVNSLTADDLGIAQ